MEPPVHDAPTAGEPGHWARSKLPDTQIVELVLSGNDAAYEAIMRRYNRFLYRIARGILGSDEDARDVVQECYIRAYFALHQFRGPAGFPSWLARIAVNEATSRARRKEIPVSDRAGAEREQADKGQRPEEAAMTRDSLRFIETAIADLPADFRLVFMLRGVEQLSVRETAEFLDINPATVKTRYHRARQILQKLLERRLEDIAPATFEFAGAHCDGIVAGVLDAISELYTKLK